MNNQIYETLIQYILDNQNAFYRLAYSYTKSQDDALDAVQNAVCKALEGYTSIRSSRGIKTWFYRILINECLTLLRQRSREAPADEQPEAVYYESAYDQPQIRLDTLDEDLQLIIKLRFFEEMSLKEIAAITGCKVNTVKTKLYRSLKLLKQTMQEEASWNN